jgi:hypothetical protein
MANTQELHRLVGKMMVDPSFRHKMARDPAGAARDEGISLTQEQEDSFKKNVHSFVSAGAELDRNVSSAAAAAGGHAVAVFRA